MKTCTKCYTTKPYSDFFAAKQHTDGLHSHCKTCLKAAKRIWQRAHPDKVRAYQKRWKTENADRIKKHNRDFYQNHIQEARHRRRAYTEEHAEEARERSRRWAKSHRAQRIEYQRVRYARKKNAPRIERINRKIVYQRDKGICSLCQTKVIWEDASLDHIIPLSKGGSHTYDNIALTHLLCNIRKRDRAITQQMRLF